MEKLQMFQGDTILLKVTHVLGFNPHAFTHFCNERKRRHIKLGEPPAASVFGKPSCDPHREPLVFVDCWYNCTLKDIDGEIKKHRLRQALELTTDWFKRALSVQYVKGNLRLSGYSACGQDGGL